MSVRYWDSKKYIKGADKKWRRYYEGESKGQKLSVKALKRKIDSCKDSNEVMRF